MYRHMGNSHSHKGLIMSSRKLEHMHHAHVKRFIEFETRMTLAGLFFVRACTYRSDAEQAQLYARGRTQKGQIVTWLRAGQSKHNHTIKGVPASLAADYYPLWNGKLATNNSPEEMQLWNTMGECARKAGLNWGGDWQNKDKPHVEVRQEDINEYNQQQIEP